MELSVGGRDGGAAADCKSVPCVVNNVGSNPTQRTNFKNTKKQGDWGLGVAIAYFVTEGYHVLIPLTDSQDYDLVIDRDGVLQKVQVKTTTFKAPSGNYSVSLTIKGGNSKRNFIHKVNKDLDYDVLFVVTGEGKRYFMPKPSTNSVQLYTKYDQYLV
jgi:hypothetical protein